MSELLQSGAWAAIGAGLAYDMQSSIFQPKGGMGQIGKAFGKALEPLIQYNCKVIDIHQDDKGVTATYIDSRTGGEKRTARADWCVCTIPASVLSQIPMNVGGPMRTAIDQIPYMAALKVGLQFKRRFWEQDDKIYGGITYTNQPNNTIGYPQWDFFSKGKGVLLGSYAFGTPAFIAAAKSPEDRIKDSLEYGSKIHPQYKDEFECGVAVAWHRVPWTLGCAGYWTEESRAAHYNDLCAIDGRIVLAGEHASRIPAWQEGAVTSSLDAIGRLHKKVVSACMSKMILRLAAAALLLTHRRVCRHGRPRAPSPRPAIAAIPTASSRPSRSRAARRSTRASARAATCPTPRARWARAPIRRWPRTRIWKPRPIRSPSS